MAESLDELIDAEFERVKNAVKALLVDHIESLFRVPSPQTIEEQYPSAGQEPSGPVTIADAAVPAKVPPPEPVAPPAPDEPSGDAVNAPSEDLPAEVPDPPAPEDGLAPGPAGGPTLVPPGDLASPPS